MTDEIETTGFETPNNVNRRGLMARTGAGIAGVAAITAAAGALGFGGNPAQAAGSAQGDLDILNFALNLEYLEAEFYLKAVSNKGLNPSDTVGGQGQAAGGTAGGGQVFFSSQLVSQYANKIAQDEQNHVRFLRQALGSAAVARPYLNIGSAFTTLAVAAGLIVQGQTFNPYQDDISFLLGAFIFEDVGVTAYAGAAALLNSPVYLSAAASILAVEAYHAGSIRTVLASMGAGVAANLISELRGKLSAAAGGFSADLGLVSSDSPANIAPNDPKTGLAFQRTTTQVLNIVYGGGASSNYLFFPNKLNGNIS